MAETTILLIDDDEDFAASIRSLLEAEGYAVVTAGSGKEGLRKLGQTSPDLVLLDVMMESTTEGYAVSGAIKAAERPIPIVMLSSVQNAPGELFARSEELELIRPDAYFTKPVDVPRFLETLRALLARRVGA